MNWRLRYQFEQNTAEWIPPRIRHCVWSNSLGSGFKTIRMRKTSRFLEKFQTRTDWRISLGSVSEDLMLKSMSNRTCNLWWARCVHNRKAGHPRPIHLTYRLAHISTWYQIRIPWHSWLAHFSHWIDAIYMWWSKQLLQWFHKEILIALEFVDFCWASGEQDNRI